MMREGILKPGERGKVYPCKDYFNWIFRKLAIVCGVFRLIFDVAFDSDVWIMTTFEIDCRCFGSIPETKLNVFVSWYFIAFVAHQLIPEGCIQPWL